MKFQGSETRKRFGKRKNSGFVLQLEMPVRKGKVAWSA